MQDCADVLARIAVERKEWSGEQYGPDFPHCDVGCWPLPINVSVLQYLRSSGCHLVIVTGE